jgi:hypothetical protein
MWKRDNEISLKRLLKKFEKQYKNNNDIKERRKRLAKNEVKPILTL